MWVCVCVCVCMRVCVRVLVCARLCMYVCVCMVWRGGGSVLGRRFRPWVLIGTSFTQYCLTSIRGSLKQGHMVVFKFSPLCVYLLLHPVVQLYNLCYLQGGGS